MKKFDLNDWLCSKGAFNWMPDKMYLKMRYRIKLGKQLNLENPRTFSEKLQWLKLYDRKPEYTMMVDKYEAKKYVADRIGEQYIIPTLGVWDTFDEIDFDSLPEQFVLKCTHDSGGLAICRDKKSFDRDAAKKKINKSLSNNYYLFEREWPYKNASRRIIAEVYMEDGGTQAADGLSDYKFFCFNGVPLYCQVIRDRMGGETIDFFDMNWEWQEFTGIGMPYKPHAKDVIPKPNSFEWMKKTAAMLSKNIPFVRIDFYEVSGNPFFGEITFYPASGLGEFSPYELNEILGKKILLHT